VSGLPCCFATLTAGLRAAPLHHRPTLGTLGPLLLTLLIGCDGLPCIESIQVAVDDLPASVSESFQAEYPGATITDAEELTGETETWDVEVETEDGQTLLLEVDGSGNLIELDFEDADRRCDRARATSRGGSSPW